MLVYWRILGVWLIFVFYVAFMAVSIVLRFCTIIKVVRRFLNVTFYATHIHLSKILFLFVVGLFDGPFVLFQHHFLFSSLPVKFFGTHLSLRH